MDKKRLEKIKENVYTRCSIATTTGIGLTAPDKEEVELIEEIERLNNIINELEKWLEEQENNSTYPSMIFIGSVKAKLQELKGSDLLKISDEEEKRLYNEAFEDSQY